MEQTLLRSVGIDTICSAEVGGLPNQISVCQLSSALPRLLIDCHDSCRNLTQQVVIWLLEKLLVDVSVVMPSMRLKIAQKMRCTPHTPRIQSMPDQQHEVINLLSRAAECASLPDDRSQASLCCI